MNRNIERIYMKNSIVPFFLFCFLCCTFTAAEGEELVHILQKGETLYGISRKYNVPAETILSWNDLKDPDKLQAGQKLRIPDVYTVIKGDTFYGIARKLLVPVDDLMEANKISGNAKLKVGQTLYIPMTSTPATVTSRPKQTAVPVTDTAFHDPRIYDTKKVDTKIIWPVSVKDISYLSGKIYGVSITSEKGEKVKVISSGTVISTGPYRGFGHVVFLQTKAGFIYVYGGLDTVKAHSGDNLSFGEEIGTLGSDSLSGKPQLYFMVYNNDIPVDPAKAPRGY
jgi:lipoprotein YgeR